MFIHVPSNPCPHLLEDSFPSEIIRNIIANELPGGSGYPPSDPRIRDGVRNQSSAFLFLSSLLRHVSAIIVTRLHTYWHCHHDTYILSIVAIHVLVSPRPWRRSFPAAMDED